MRDSVRPQLLCVATTCQASLPGGGQRGSNRSIADRGRFAALARLSFFLLPLRDAAGTDYSQWIHPPSLFAPEWRGQKGKCCGKRGKKNCCRNRHFYTNSVVQA